MVPNNSVVFVFIYSTPPYSTCKKVSVLFACSLGSGWPQSELVEWGPLAKLSIGGCVFKTGL